MPGSIGGPRPGTPKPGQGGVKQNQTEGQRGTLLVNHPKPEQKTTTVTKPAKLPATGTFEPHQVEDHYLRGELIQLPTKTEVNIVISRTNFRGDKPRPEQKNQIVDLIIKHVEYRTRYLSHANNTGKMDIPWPNDDSWPRVYDFINNLKVEVQAYGEGLKRFDNATFVLKQKPVTGASSEVLAYDRHGNLQVEEGGPFDRDHMPSLAVVRRAIEYQEGRPLKDIEVMYLKLNLPSMVVPQWVHALFSRTFMGNPMHARMDALDLRQALKDDIKEMRDGLKHAKTGLAPERVDKVLDAYEAYALGIIFDKDGRIDNRLWRQMLTRQVPQNESYVTGFKPKSVEQPTEVPYGLPQKPRPGESPSK